MNRYKIILNPTSGKGAGVLAQPQLVELLEQQHLDYDLVQTQYPWQAAELTQQAVSQGFQVVVAVGGDGTVNEVVNGLMLSKTNSNPGAALGVISIGRGNDFAHGAGVPSEMPQAVKNLVEDQRRWIDIGFVAGGDYPQGRFFANGVGVGFDAVVGFEAMKIKGLNGFPLYVAAALKTILLYHRGPKVKLEFNDSSIELDTLLVSIMNGRRMGGGFYMAPHSQMDDDLFDVCIANQVSRSEIIALIPHFMKGDQETHPAIQTVQTKSLTIKALRGSLPVHADGETICISGQELSIQILPRQIQVIANNSKPNQWMAS